MVIGFVLGLEEMGNICMLRLKYDHIIIILEGEWLSEKEEKLHISEAFRISESTGITCLHSEKSKGKKRKVKDSLKQNNWMFLYLLDTK